MSGSNKLDAKDKIGIRGTMNVNGINVDYYETDTLQEVIRKINESGARVNAFLNPQGKLTLKADYQLTSENPDFVIQHIEDNGLFLTGYAGLLNASGQAGAFDWQAINQVNQLTGASQWAIAPLVHPSAYMKIEDKIAVDNSYIACSSGVDMNGDGVKDRFNGVGDSSNALRIASIKQERVMVGMSQTFTQYFESLISEVGAKGSHAEKGFKGSEVIVNNLENIRKSISGVNIDEEFANMIKFQQGYNATARIMTVMDDMINTLITKLG
jgi:flagellar hook-associated protein 1 FlgK